MLTCGGLPRVLVLIGPLATGVGRHYVLARIGMAHIHKPGEDIQWCSECERYYNPKVPHECIDVKIKESQRALEKFLGRYKVLGES